VIPPLAFEHFEHGDVFGIERVALDLLKVHGLKAPLARRRNLFGRETIFDFGHISNIRDSAQEVTNLNPSSRDRFTLPGPPQMHFIDNAAALQESDATI
jgi:hypothetical protein